MADNTTQDETVPSESMDEILDAMLRPGMDSYYANRLAVACKDDEFILCFGFESHGQKDAYEKRIVLTRSNAVRLMAMIEMYTNPEKTQ